MTSSMTKPGL